MDIMGTLIACVVPCLQHGQIHEKQGWGGCMTGGLLYLFAMSCGCNPCVNTWRREAIRRQNGIKGNLADDILASSTCGTCALVQEYHECHDAPAQ
ncbi:hypothetical protein HK101_008333 [Irineochytrium annulatum]|nr:hypothetical protein HK101_008333 [Irineochytrium annulatum]